jgi:KipI family sensor histidine kinase inhibitor
VIIRPYGDRAVLIEADDVLGLLSAVRELPGVEEVVPAARTLLVRHASGFDLGGLSRVRPAAVAAGPEPAAIVTLPVRYDGADLPLIADTAACSVEEVIGRHTAVTYVVAFCGFAPGFAYLRGLDPALQQSRLASPRTSVPAGSVGVAGEFTGVYPRASPGGWRLLGHTGVPLWDLERDPPALLAPGTRVRFAAT